MYFIVLFATVNIFVAIDARHKTASTDISSGDSQQELSLENDLSGSADYDDEMQRSKDHVHKYGRDSRKHMETRRWHRNCLRKASNMCTKACQNAYKNVCKKRKCSRRAKQTLKRECRKSCTRNFEFDKDRAAYEE
nr:uncharacterized protein LOC126056945 [Helicoverpa armigera]